MKNLFDLKVMYMGKFLSYKPEMMMMMMRWKARLGKTKQGRLGLRINSQTVGKSSRSQILDSSVPNTTSVRPCNYAHFGHHHHHLLQYHLLLISIHNIAIANTNTNTITNTTQARLVIMLTYVDFQQHIYVVQCTLLCTFSWSYPSLTCCF